MTPLEAVHDVVPDSKPGFRIFWPEQEPPPPVPESNTPWEELYREKTGQLGEGGALEFALKYRRTSEKPPRHNH